MHYLFTILISTFTSSISFIDNWTPSLPILILLFLTSLIYRPLLTCLHASNFLCTSALRALRHGGPIPSHIAFIMDGNRRWARKSNLPVHEGHPAGGKKLIQSLQWCLDAGVQVVTVYAFSIENFKRSPVEVAEIMALAERNFHSLAHNAHLIHSHRVRVRVLGDFSRIPPSLRAIMASIMTDTARYHDGPTLNICFAYTARHDMATAVTELANHCGNGSIKPHHITAHAISACLSTGYAKGAPTTSHPQLVVRTSGETRLSDFLLWESAHSILCFYPVLWPDLTAWDFVRIVLNYQSQRKNYDKVHPPQKTIPHPLPEMAEACCSSEPCGVCLGTKPVMDTLEQIRSQHFEQIAAYCS